MGNKYFTPSIEDIRIGYECEKILMGEFDTHFDLFLPETATKEDYHKAWGDCYYNTDRIKSEKYVVTKEDLIKFLQFDGDLRSGKGSPTLGFMRTSYLTKEQIEAEGWDFGSSYLFIVNYSEEGKDEEIRIGRKNNYKLVYNFYTHKLKIAEHNPQEPVLFNGECKDINEFRQIFKLLNIQ